MDSEVVAHRLSCSKSCGIFPDKGSNPCPLHWQADSYPLYHQGSPSLTIEGFQFLSCFKCQHHLLSFVSLILSHTCMHMCRWTHTHTHTPLQPNCSPYQSFQCHTQSSLHGYLEWLLPHWYFMSDKENKQEVHWLWSQFNLGLNSRFAAEYFQVLASFFIIC